MTANPDKIRWSLLSANPNAIELLKENQDNIGWAFLMLNPSIFTYDYEKMKKTKADLNEEVIAKTIYLKK